MGTALRLTDSESSRAFRPRTHSTGHRPFTLLQAKAKTLTLSGERGCHPPCLDLCGICGGVKQSVTVVGRGDQRKLRARREGKDKNALRCISKGSG